MSEELAIQQQKDESSFVWVYHFILDMVAINKLSRTDLLVYLTLCRFSGKTTNQCYPSVKTISDHCGVEQQGVTSSIIKLIKQRIISVEQRYGLSNLYTIHTYKQVREFIPVSKKDTRIEKGYLPVSKKDTQTITNNNISLSKDNDYVLSESESTKLSRSSYERNPGPESKTTSSEEDLLQYWNEKEIINHRKLTSLIVKSIHKLLKEDYNYIDIRKGIDIYSEVLQDKKCFFKYKWTLNEFLSRENGFRTFVEKQVEDYAKK